MSKSSERNIKRLNGPPIKISPPKLNKVTGQTKSRDRVNISPSRSPTINSDIQDKIEE